MGAADTSLTASGITWGSRHERGERVMMTHRMLVACAMALVLSGCAAAPSREATMVHDADAAMVHSCQFVGTVVGHSKLAGMFEATGESNAQTDAREKAAQLGANYIVWRNLSGNYWSTPNVSGDAYRCP